MSKSVWAGLTQQTLWETGHLLNQQGQTYTEALANPIIFDDELDQPTSNVKPQRLKALVLAERRSRGIATRVGQIDTLQHQLNTDKSLSLEQQRQIRRVIYSKVKSLRYWYGVDFHLNQITTS